MEERGGAGWWGARFVRYAVGIQGGLARVGWEDRWVVERPGLRDFFN